MGRHGLPIGDREAVLSEVCHIVPDVKMRSDSGPVLEILHEGDILLAVVIVMEHAALDATEADHHIVPRDYVLRSVAGVLVSEGSDELVRELILDRISDLIHEPHHEAGLAAIFLGKSLALFALAI